MNRSIFSLALSALVAVPAFAETPRAHYNTPIPSVIMTPDTVETRIGRLEFNDGRPTADTSQRVFEHLDFIRGVEGAS